MNNFDSIKQQLLSIDDINFGHQDWFKIIEHYYKQNENQASSQEHLMGFANILTKKFLSFISFTENNYNSPNKAIEPSSVKVMLFEYLFHNFKTELDPNYTDRSFVKARHNTKLLSSILMTNLQHVWDSITVNQYLLNTSAKTDIGPINKTHEAKLKEIKLANSIINCFFPYGNRPALLASGVDSGTSPEAEIGVDAYNVVFNQWLIEKDKGLHIKNKLMKIDSALMSKLDDECQITMHADRKESCRHNFFAALSGVILYTLLDIPAHKQNKKIANEVLSHFGLTPGASITPFFNMMMFNHLFICSAPHKKIIIEQMEKTVPLPLIDFLIKNKYTLNKDLEILKEKINLEATICAPPLPLRETSAFKKSNKV